MWVSILYSCDRSSKWPSGSKTSFGCPLSASLKCGDIYTYSHGIVIGTAVGKQMSAEFPPSCLHEADFLPTGFCRDSAAMLSYMEQADKAWFCQ